MSEVKDLEQLFSDYKIRGLIIKRVEKNPLSDEVTAYVAGLLRDFFGEESEMDIVSLTMCHFFFLTIEDRDQFAFIIIACLFGFEFEDVVEQNPLGSFFQT